MNAQRSVVLTLASLLVLPTLAFAAIVQKWQSPPANYAVVSEFNDLNGDGSYEMLTVEGGGKIGIRSCSTGALLAQTAATYQPAKFWITYLEPTNEIAEIIFSDVASGNLVCVNYTGSNTVPVRWSFMPTASGVPSTWEFVDFDGNGQPYMVFKDTGVNAAKYYIRNNSGGLVSTIDLTATAPGSGWTAFLLVDDFEANNRQGLMIDYRATSPVQDQLYLFDSNAPAPGTPVGRASELRPTHVRPAVRAIEQVSGAWAEAGNQEMEPSGVQRAVRLP